MEIQNSRLDFYIGLITALHSDVASTAHISKVEQARDLVRILARVTAEGASFLTKTLPKMGKAIDLALSSGGRLQWPFSKLRKNTQLPIFLGSLISQVFDSEGRQRSDASIPVLDGLRQLLYLFYKLELPYTADTVAKTVSQFVSVDNECNLAIDELPDDAREILDVARNIVRLVTSDLDMVNISPKHGPGVVSTGQAQWDKPHFNRVIEKLDAKYPYVDYFCFNYSHVCDDLDKILNLPRVDSGLAKLVAVPKDSRGPRLISAEPLENQWIQQGQMQNIVRHLESHPLTAGRINFRDQTINGRLALEGSLTQEWSTLDMKEASDRVSLDLVKYLFNPHIWEYFDASRSTHTLLPDGTLHELKKFAPMGSALCFPVESLVFWALAVSSIICKHKVPLSQAARSIYVYGDDIICHGDHHVVIKQYLPYFGLLFNEDKCCTAGSFRESCGVDAFNGVDVTPIKCRTVWSHSLSPDCISSYVAYSNSLWTKKYICAAQYIEDRLQNVIRLPYSQSARVGCIAFVRPGLDTVTLNRKCGVKARFNVALWRHEICAPVIVPSKIRRCVSTWAELLYYWLANDAPFGAMFVPTMYNSVSSFDDQKRLMMSQSYDRAVQEETVFSCLSPITRPLPGEYTVRHRNRLQWRWLGSDN